MYVGFVVPGSLDLDSGGYRFDRILAASLRERGHRVGVVTTPTGGYPRRVAANAARGLWRRLRGSAFDVLLQDELAHPSLALRNRRLAGQVEYPIVAVVHHLRSAEPRSALDRRLSRALERRYLDACDAFVCNSHATRRSVRRATTTGSSPAVVAYPGADHLRPTVEPAEVVERTSRGPLRLLYLGALVPRKGADVLLSALERVGDLAWTLTLVGDETVAPRYVRGLRRSVEAADLRGSVRFEGRLDRASLRERLRESHVLAVPSYYEGFGMVYAEAMGFGVVPLATTAGAPSEYITDGRDGILVPPGDPGAVAAAIRDVGRDRDRLAALGRGALARHGELPTWRDSCARINDFLQGVAG